MSKKVKSSQNLPVDAKFITDTLQGKMNRMMLQMRSGLQEQLEQRGGSSQTRVTRNPTYEHDEHDDESNYDEVISHKRRRVQARDNNL